jgi:hypothetical protein
MPASTGTARQASGTASGPFRGVQRQVSVRCCRMISWPNRVIDEHQFELVRDALEHVRAVLCELAALECPVDHSQ